MIYIVEIPDQRPPMAWSGESEEEVISVIEERAAMSLVPIYEADTGRKILDMFGYESTDEMREDNTELADMADMIDAHGVDATYYIGYGDTDYQTEPVDKFGAHIEYNGHDLSQQRVFMSDKEAIEAYCADSEWCGHHGIEARDALKHAMINNDLMPVCGSQSKNGQ